MQQPKLRFKTDDGDDFPNLEVKRLGDITIPYNARNKNTLPLEIYSVNNIVCASFCPRYLLLSAPGKSSGEVQTPVRFQGLFFPEAEAQIHHHKDINQNI